MYRKVIAAFFVALILAPSVRGQTDLLNPGRGGSGRSLDLLRGLDTPPPKPRRGGSTAKPLPYRPDTAGAKEIFSKLPFSPFVGPRFSRAPFGIQSAFPSWDVQRSVRNIFRRDLSAPSLEPRYRLDRGVQVQRSPDWK